MRAVTLCWPLKGIQDVASSRRGLVLHTLLPMKWARRGILRGSQTGHGMMLRADPGGVAVEDGRHKVNSAV